MAALPASGAGCETRSRPRPGAARPDPGPPAAPRVPLPGAAVPGRGGAGRGGAGRGGSGQARPAVAAEPRVEGSPWRRARPLPNPTEPAESRRSSGPRVRNKETGSGAGTSVLEPLKPYLSYRSMAKASGRDPFGEENSGQAGHSYPRLGDLWAALLLRAQVRPVLDHSCPGEPCSPAAASRSPGHMGLYWFCSALWYSRHPPRAWMESGRGDLNQPGALRDEKFLCHAGC